MKYGKVWSNTEKCMSKRGKICVAMTSTTTTWALNLIKSRQKYGDINRKEVTNCYSVNRDQQSSIVAAGEG
jgi:hypothetical protein